MFIEHMGNGVMKDKPITSHSVISNLQPFNKIKVAEYSRLILADHNLDQSGIDEICAFVVIRSVIWIHFLLIGILIFQSVNLLHAFLMLKGICSL